MFSKYDMEECGCIFAKMSPEELVAEIEEQLKGNCILTGKIYSVIRGCFGKRCGWKCRPYGPIKGIDCKISLESVMEVINALQESGRIKFTTCHGDEPSYSQVPAILIS